MRLKVIKKVKVILQGQGHTSRSMSNKFQGKIKVASEERYSYVSGLQLTQMRSCLKKMHSKNDSCDSFRFWCNKCDSFDSLRLWCEKCNSFYSRCKRCDSFDSFRFWCKVCESVTVVTVFLNRLRSHHSIQHAF